MAAGAVTGPGSQGETPKFEAPKATETALPTPVSSEDEAYKEQVAKAYHQLNTSLANDKESFLNAETAYKYQRALLEKEEPERYAANRYRGVREGISESGIQNNRIEGITGGFALRGGQNLSRFQEAANRIKAAEEAQVYGYGQGIAGAGKGLNRRTLERLEKENPQTPEPAPAPYIAPGFLPQPGGTLPGGAYAPGNTTNVRVGPNTLSARRAAAAKARKR